MVMMMGADRGVATNGIPHPVGIPCGVVGVAVPMPVGLLTCLSSPCLVVTGSGGSITSTAGSTDDRGSGDFLAGGVVGPSPILFGADTEPASASRSSRGLGGGSVGFGSLVVGKQHLQSRGGGASASASASASVGPWSVRRGSRSQSLYNGSQTPNAESIPQRHEREREKERSSHAASLDPLHRSLSIGPAVSTHGVDELAILRGIHGRSLSPALLLGNSGKSTTTTPSS